jgi:amino acid efflux transporter
VPRGAALYIGALLGPGLLLLPGLAAAQAGPASVLAWLALIITSALLAGVFTALGRAVPAGGGVIGYTAAGLGRRAGVAAGWCFLAGVICGAPIVCLIGASYVTDLAGGGPLLRAAVAGGLLLAVLGLALGGVRATTTAQLVLVALLIAVVVAAVTGAAPAARAANWAPFAPHGWLAIGKAAATLMLSFIGWEAVAPLTTRFASPARQLPRVIAIAFGTTTALYLGLAVTTIATLGRGAGTSVPLADLLQIAIGPAGRAVAAAAALVLTLGATNAYLTGATEMIRQLTAARRPRSTGLLPGQARPAATQPAVTQPAVTQPAVTQPAVTQPAVTQPEAASPGPVQRLARPGSARPFLLVIAAAGLLLIGLYALGLVSTAALVALPTTMFLVVYVTCTASAARILTGPARIAAVPALLAVLAVLAFCGWALIAAAVVAGLAALTAPASSPALARPRIPAGVARVQRDGA